MKKLLFILTVFCLLTACENDSCKEIESSLDATATYEVVPDVVKNLKNFNDSLMQSSSLSISSGMMTRGGWGKLWTTFSADVLAVPRSFKTSCKVAGFILAVTGGTAGTATTVGVLCGTAFLAGGVSYGAYKRSSGGCTYSTTIDEYLSTLKNNELLYSKFKKFEETTNPIVSLNNDALSEMDTAMCADVAQLHNDILSCLEDAESAEEGSILVATGLTEVAPNEESDGGDENSYGIKIYSDNDMVNMTNMVSSKLSTYCDDENYSEVLQSFKEDDEITENTEEILSLLFAILQENVNSKTNMYSIISHYENEIVSSSDMTVDEKNVLLLCLETAKYSYTYWYDQGVR